MKVLPARVCCLVSTWKYDLFMPCGIPFHQNWFSTDLKGRCNQPSFLRMTLTLKKKKYPLPLSQCCFRCGSREKAEIKGQFPTKDEAVFVNCFRHYIFNAWSHLWAERSQSCQAKMCWEWAPVRLCQHAWWVHVCSSCYPLVQGCCSSSPEDLQVHKSHLSFMSVCVCVCVILEPTPATNQHRWGQHWCFYTSVRTHVNTRLRSDR